MRKIILGLLLSISCVLHAKAQAPDWVTQRPTSSDALHRYWRRIVIGNRLHQKSDPKCLIGHRFTDCRKA